MPERVTINDRRLAVPVGGPIAVKRLRTASTELRPEPRFDMPIDSELLCGEIVDLHQQTEEGWALVRSHTDNYVGWCSADSLRPVGAAATHAVSALRTHVYPAPSIKLPPVDLISITAQVTVVGVEDEFSVLDTGGFVVTRHLREIATPEQDWVAVAGRFVGTPYLWGGRTSLALDCSALIQLSMAAAGIACPRDSDMQEGRVDGISGPGTMIDLPNDIDTFQRGDLLFWQGHVAIALENGQMLHANGHSMNTAVEPLGPAIERIAGQGLALRSVRRLGT